LYIPCKKKGRGQYCLRSEDLLLLSVPHVQTEMGKGLFMCVAPSAWNQLQNVLNLQEPVSLVAFKLLLNDIEATHTG